MHYLDLFVAGLFGLLTLLVAEYGYVKGAWHGEGARKFAHIAIGLQAALWPLYLDWFEIRLISIALTIGFIVCMRLRMFQSLGAVERVSYGEVLFALAIGALTLVTHSPAIYAAAILHLSVADGLAALVGSKYGKRTRYKVLGHTKSIVGSATFFVTSLIILASYGFATGGLMWGWTLGGAAVATALENVGVYGLDNIVVPAFVVGLLSII
jgi:phytol kinase